MPAGDLDRRFAHGGKINGALPPRDGRRRLERRAEHERRARRDAAEDTAAAVRLRHSPPAAQHKGVVILAAAQRGGGEPRAELHALHSGNTEERRGETALHAVKKRVAETRRQTEHRALHHAADAVAVGADALLMVTPYYNKTSQAGLVAHYTYVADRVDAPIILYNVPSRTGVNIKPETYKELSKHPRIVAVKEANGDISSVATTKQLCGDDLVIYSGNDDQIVPILSLGGMGVISVLSNILPAETHAICARFFEGEIGRAHV